MIAQYYFCRMSVDETVFQKARKYCAFQERSQQEVRDKLYEWGQHRNDVEQIIAQLIGDDFLNEQRFAIAFAGGKFRINQWGRLKIKQALEAKRVSKPCINEALAKLNVKDYSETLKKIIAVKTRAVKETNTYKKKHKVAMFAISKGYEPELVWEIIREDN